MVNSLWGGVGWGVGWPLLQEPEPALRRGNSVKEREETLDINRILYSPRCGGQRPTRLGYFSSILTSLEFAMYTHWLSGYRDGRKITIIVNNSSVFVGLKL